MSAPSFHKVLSPNFKKHTPVLSVLIPFYRDNPEDLLVQLLSQDIGDKHVEILIYDDGTGDADINASLSATVKSASRAAGLLIADGNRGRSFARNTLVEFARADWVLFLDADMLPVSGGFLERYVEQIETDSYDILFGGFNVTAKSEDPDRELHRAFSQVSDALSVEERQAYGPQYVCTSNLCVRKSLLKAEPFDPDFNGWGWEDSEWAARVAKSYRLHHLDNPALHLGLESTETLLKRFQTSGPNYARFTTKHPELAKTLTLYRVVEKLRKFPGHQGLRPVLKHIVRSHVMPMGLRLFALKLWRASWYAEARP